jgi:hypothetical protein
VELRTQNTTQREGREDGQKSLRSGQLRGEAETIHHSYELTTPLLRDKNYETEQPRVRETRACIYCS